MICPVKHTKFQPTDEQWRCPRCEAGHDYFWIDAYQDGADKDCVKIHPGDYIFCGYCKNSFTGNQVARMISKKLHLLPCSHCKGLGFVEKESL